jgi:hypothetical protein
MPSICGTPLRNPDRALSGAKISLPSAGALAPFGAAHNPARAYTPGLTPTSRLNTRDR